MMLWMMILVIVTILMIKRPWSPPPPPPQRQPWKERHWHRQPPTTTTTTTTTTRQRPIGYVYNPWTTHKQRTGLVIMVVLVTETLWIKEEEEEDQEKEKQRNNSNNKQQQQQQQQYSFLVSYTKLLSQYCTCVLFLSLPFPSIHSCRRYGDPVSDLVLILFSCTTVVSFPLRKTQRTDVRFYRRMTTTCSGFRWVLSDFITTHWVQKSSLYPHYDRDAIFFNWILFYHVDTCVAVSNRSIIWFVEGVSFICVLRSINPEDIVVSLFLLFFVCCCFMSIHICVWRRLGLILYFRWSSFGIALNYSTHGRRWQFIDH